MRRMSCRVVVLLSIVPFLYAQQGRPNSRRLKPPLVPAEPANSAAEAPVNPPEIINSQGKRRAFVPPPGELLAPPPPPPAGPVGQCPGGPSLPVECDPKRPWPQCPPQSYCYATNSVDIGPYFCCPVWSTYGAAWRPATPFFDYVPPRPYNWGPGAPPPPALGPAPPALAAPLPVAAYPVPAPLPVKAKRTVDQQELAATEEQN